MATGHTDSSVPVLRLGDNCRSSGAMGDPVLFGAPSSDSSVSDD